MNNKLFTLKELEKMETISQGHMDNLKYQDTNIKIWLSRMTIEDGAEYNNQVTVENYINNEWVTVLEYQAL